MAYNKETINTGEVISSKWGNKVEEGIYSAHKNIEGVKLQLADIVQIFDNSKKIYIECYIDYNNGSDENVGNINKPFKTIEGAIKHLNSKRYVKAYESFVFYIRGFYPKQIRIHRLCSSLTIQGYGSGASFIGAEIDEIDNVTIDGITLVKDINNQGIDVLNCGMVRIYNVKIYGKGTNPSHCIQTENCIIVKLQDITVDSSAYCFLYSENTLRVFLDNIQGKLSSTHKDSRVMYVYNTDLYEYQDRPVNIVGAATKIARYSFYNEI